MHAYLCLPVFAGSIPKYHPEGDNVVRSTNASGRLPRSESHPEEESCAAGM
jgi:hypothetical protein